MSDRPRRSRNTATFNTACPIHRRRCKCSFRKPLPSQDEAPVKIEAQPNQALGHRSVHTAQLVASFVEPFAEHRSEPYYAWLFECVTTDSTSKALTKSLLALSLGHIARCSQDSTMWHRAELAYTDALVHLQRDVSDPILVKTDATLASCLMVGRYQDFRSSAQPDHVAAHVLGLIRMIQLRGPNSFRTSILGRKLLAFLFPAVATFALYSGTASFFSRHEWQELIVPTASPGDTADWWYEVHSLTAALAEFRARQQTRLSRDDSVDLFNDGKNLVRRSQELLQRFPFSEPTTTPTTIAFPELDFKKPFAESFVFDNGYAALLTVDVWATLSVTYLLLHQTLQKERHDSKSTTPPPETFEPISCASLAIEYAVRVCQGVQYVVDEHPTMFGRLSLVLPLPLTAQALALGGPEHAELVMWIQLVMSRITQGRTPDRDHDTSAGRTSSEALDDYWSKYEQLNITSGMVNHTPRS